jgi:divalent metal cation (Fe/Co/Zn/Cd) transporter
LVSLVGFGLGSGIESAAAVLVGLRLAARLRRGDADEATERRTLKAVAVTFYLLAGYAVVEGIRDLIGGHQPDRSTIGVLLLVASIVVMPLPARAKRRVAPLILADTAETRICVLLSVCTLAGLVLYAMTGAAWLDPVAGFVIAVFAIREGREAWHGELVEQHDHDESRGPE